MNRLTTRYMPLGALLALTIAGLSAAACSAGSGGNVAGSLLAIDVVRAAPQQAEAAGTFRVEWTMRIEGVELEEPGYDREELERELREADARGELDDLDETDSVALYLVLWEIMLFEGMHGHIDSDTANNRSQSFAEAGPFVFESVRDGTDCYSRMRPPSGALWVRNVDCSETMDNMADVESLFDSFRELGGDVEDLGSNELRGIDARTYRMTVPPMEDVPMEQVLDLWVDDAGRPLRLQSSVVIDEWGLREFASGVTYTMVMDFVDYGVPIDVVVPDESEVSRAAKTTEEPGLVPTQSPDSQVQLSSEEVDDAYVEAVCRSTEKAIDAILEAVFLIDEAEMKARLSGLLRTWHNELAVAVPPADFAKAHGALLDALAESYARVAELDRDDWFETELLDWYAEDHASSETIERLEALFNAGPAECASTWRGDS